MDTLFQELENTLGRACEDAQYWDAALNIVVEILGGRGALIPATDPFFRGTWMAGTKKMKEALPSYISEGWASNDPREAVISLMMERGYACDHDVFADHAARDMIPIVLDVDGKQCFSINSSGKIRTRARLGDVIPNEMSTALGAEIRELCSSDPSLSMSRAYQFNIAAKSRSVLIIQIPPNLRHFFMHFKVCAIRTECSDTTALKQSCLRENYGLSAAEVATVDLLVGGKTPNMIAELLSVKATTVRQRLKQMQVNSQVELIALHNRL